MFCHKCGNQVAEDAGFCHKCGAKVAQAVGAVGQQAPAVHTQSPVLDAPVSINASGLGDTDRTNNDFKDFKDFVDNHVRATTKFQSAEDLLNNSKPLMFIWVCIGVPAIVGLVSGGPVGFLIFGGLFGYVATFIASGIIRVRYRGKFSGEFIGDINIEELLIFLNEHLKQINPYFHEWGYLTKTGLLPILENALANAMEEVRICSEFGPKKKSMVAIYIKPKTVDAKPREKLYYVDALKNGFLMDGRAAGFLGHSTLIRTAPILQAAMKYYLKDRNTGKENNNYVL